MSDGFDAKENLRKIRNSLFEPLSDEQKALLPEAEKALLRQEHPEGLWAWRMPLWEEV